MEAKDSITGNVSEEDSIAGNVSEEVKMSDKRINQDQINFVKTNDIGSPIPTIHSTTEATDKTDTTLSTNQNDAAGTFTIDGAELTFETATDSDKGMKSGEVVSNNKIIDSVELEASVPSSKEVVELQSFNQMQANTEELSSSDVSDSSDDEESGKPAEEAVRHDSDEEGEGSSKQRKPGAHVKAGPLVPGEVSIYDLPPLEELQINIDDKVELCELGSVTSIIDTLVVIKAKPGTSPLDEETVLFMEGRKSIGKVFETFGPVISPYYSVRFNSVQDISSSGIKVDDVIYYAPKEDKSLTTYVFVSRLTQSKGSDASWVENLEPPEHYVDYSDDEQERSAKSKMKAKNRKPDSAQDSVNGGGDNSKRARPQADVGNLQERARHTRPARHGQPARPVGPPHRFSRPPGDLIRPPVAFQRPPRGYAPSPYDSAPPHPEYHYQHQYDQYPPGPHYQYHQYPPGGPQYPPGGPQYPPGGHAPPPHYPPYNYPPSSYPSPYASGWQGYGGAWTADDKNYYSQETKKLSVSFVDNRYVQQSNPATGENSQT